MVSLKGAVLIVTVSLCLPPAGSAVCGPEHWSCGDTLCVAMSEVCDGTLDCNDGDDEVLEHCRKSGRPLLGLNLFCSQGWSRRHEGICPEACRLWPDYCYYALAAEHGAPSTCILPEIPFIGQYNIEDITPHGDEPADFSLNYSCPPGYRLVGENPRCANGNWTSAFPSCLPAPQIKECGTLTPNHDALLANGVTPKRIELPWHAGIYNKRYTPYEQICGGTLVSNTIIITAAHCFWADATDLQRAEHYAVVVGKFYREWALEDGGQRSDVSDIKIPPRFHGAETNYQDDLAVVTLAKPVVFTDYVRPVCIDFSRELDNRQLRPGNIGKVAGWGLTSEDGTPSELLKVVELANVDVVQCIAMAPPFFRQYVTSDKICAGAKNGTAICKGDSGGGLVFPDKARGAQRWYLRGVASVAPRDDHLCNFHTYTFFTQLSKHEFFLSNYQEGQ